MVKLYRNFNINNNSKKSILLIGNFDGLHLGHQKIFLKAKKYSRKFKMQIGVLTFDPPPTMFFNNKIINYKILNNFQKFYLLKKFAADYIINKKFDKKFSKITSSDFIKKIIVNKINPKFIFVSNNFKFGNKRKGNVKQLIKYGNKYNFKVVKPSPLKRDKKIISSTLVRNLIVKGKIKQANKLLSRNWVIQGTVQKGKRLGKKLGFPTCNIDINNYVKPKSGVYSVKVVKNNSKKVFNGVAYLGYRPTFKGKKLLLEVNLFRFNGNLYRKNLNVYFYNFIRGERKYKNSKRLVYQMKKDLRKAKFDLKNKIIL
tara:strand:- start:307 stop:1248 length:942 start_codon:yes stop_codon:yes gene_type:complete